MFYVMAGREKLVAVSVATRNFGTPDASPTVPDNYLQKIGHYTCIPLLVSGTMDMAAIDKLYEMSKGILLTGGRDINPALYGEEPHPKTDIPDPQRDAMELELARRAFEDGKPILGICRGAQILAIAAGGKLDQHLPDHTTEVHRAEGKRVATVPHPVILTPHTRIAEIFGLPTITSPSRHHQAIKHPGNLIVAGVSEAGVIEIVEHPDYPFVVGFQGHPETTDELDTLFAAFAKAAQNYRKPRTR